jgi:Zn finger protein HypA/HybF involved in hydrogenase expression
MTDCPQCHLIMDEFKGRFLCDKCGQVVIKIIDGLVAEYILSLRPQK